MYYFDFINDDLLFIIQTYLEINYNLNMFGDNLIKIYNKYIKIIDDIQNGNVDPYDINNKFIFDYIGKKMFTFTNDKSNYYNYTRGFSFITSTSKYDFRSVHVYNILFMNRKNVELLTKIYRDYKNIQIIYYYNKASISTDYAISNIHVLKATDQKDNIKYIFSEISNLLDLNDSENDKYITNNWKELWDKLSIDTKNAILYQNYFPLIK